MLPQVPDVQKHVPPNLATRDLLFLIAPYELEKADGVAHWMNAADFIGVNRGDWD